MPTAVSPEATVCVRGLMAVVAFPERFVFAVVGCVFWAGWAAVGRVTALFVVVGELVLAAANWLE